MVRSTDGRQAAALHQRQVDARRGKAGAAGDDDMGDARTVLPRQQLFRRLHRQAGRAGLELLHARGRVGKSAQAIKAFRIHRRAARASRLQERNSGGRCRCARPCG